MGVWEEAGWGWWGGQGPAPHVLMKSWTPRGDCRRAASLLQPLPGVQATHSPVRGSCPRSSLWPSHFLWTLRVQHGNPWAWHSLGKPHGRVHTDMSLLCLTLPTRSQSHPQHRPARNTRPWSPPCGWITEPSCSSVGFLICLHRSPN